MWKDSCNSLLTKLVNVGFVFLSLFRTVFEMRSTFLSSHVTFLPCMWRMHTWKGSWDFPWWSSGQDVAFQSRGMGSSPGQGARIPHASWPKYQNTEQKQCGNKISKDFKNDIRQKNLKKKKESSTSKMQVNEHCICFLLQNMSDIKSWVYHHRPCLHHNSSVLSDKGQWQHAVVIRVPSPGLGFPNVRSVRGTFLGFELGFQALQMPMELMQLQLLSRVQLFATPWTTARQASLSITNSQSLPKPVSIELVMPSNHFILCRPLLFLPSILPSIRIFSNESALRIRWPNVQSVRGTFFGFELLAPGFADAHGATATADKALR